MKECQVCFWRSQGVRLCDCLTFEFDSIRFFCYFLNTLFTKVNCKFFCKFNAKTQETWHSVFRDSRRFVTLFPLLLHTLSLAVAAPGTPSTDRAILGKTLRNSKFTRVFTL